MPTRTWESLSAVPVNLGLVSFVAAALVNTGASGGAVVLPPPPPLLLLLPPPLPPAARPTKPSTPRPMITGRAENSDSAAATATTGATSPLPNIKKLPSCNAPTGSLAGVTAAVPPIFEVSNEQGALGTQLKKKPSSSTTCSCGKPSTTKELRTRFSPIFSLKGVSASSTSR